MVSKSQSKLIRSLNQKKYRAKHGLFVVEGTKSINEFLSSKFQLYQLFSTTEDFNVTKEQFSLVSETELQAITMLSTGQKALAIFKIPKDAIFNLEGNAIMLDGLRDPGNLGTIIRLCDWFGIATLICSKDTVDCYNPKVVQASMGSLTRVSVVYADVTEVLKTTTHKVYGTFMDGTSLYSESLNASPYIIVMGNEANGISEAVERYCEKRIAIPQFGASEATESLNVATATAITLSEFARQATER